MQPEALAKIAHLARLSISEDEAEAAAGSITKILDMIAKMDEIDTADITPMAHAFDVDQPLREDNVTETDQRDALMANAPKADAGLFLVPKVIE